MKRTGDSVSRDAVCRLLIGTAPVPQSSSFARARGDEQDLPGSWAAPSRTCSALRPRRTGCAKATNDASDVAFRSVDDVGSARDSFTPELAARSGNGQIKGHRKRPIQLRDLFR
jgi:hypothetical protein